MSMHTADSAQAFSARAVLRLLFRSAVVPCIFAAVVFLIYCLTAGNASRVFFVHQGPQERYGLPLVIDEGGYVTIADNLVHGNGYRMGWPDGYLTARRMPLYPLLLAGLFKLFGLHGWLGLALNGGLIVGTVSLAGSIARLLSRRGVDVSPVVARWCVVLVPSLYYFSSLIQTEALALFLSTSIVFLLLTVLQAFRGQSSTGRLTRLVACLGVTCGLAVLTRPELSVASALCGGVLLVVVLRQDRRRWYLVLIFSLGIALLWGSWIARNYRDFGAFVPLSTTGGTEFFGAHNAVVWATDRGSWGDPPRILGAEAYGRLNALGEARREQELMKLGLQWIQRQDVATILLLEAYKLGRSWIPYEFVVHRYLAPAANILVSVLFFPFWGLAILGALALVRRHLWRACAALLLLPAANTLVSLLASGSARYRFTSYAALAVLAAVGLARWRAWMRAKHVIGHAVNRSRTDGRE